jgi:hypothetical protein
MGFIQIRRHIHIYRFKKKKKKVFLQRVVQLISELGKYYTVMQAAARQYGTVFVSLYGNRILVFSA